MSRPSALFGVFLAVYLVLLVGVGALKARKVRTQADFSLAGRGLSTFVLVGTLLATWIGTGSIFGNAEKTVAIGLGGFVLPVAGALGILVLVRLAGRIRDFGQFTVQDILEARFGVGPRIMGTVALFCAYVIIVSYQYRAGEAVLSYVVPELGRTNGILCVAAFVIVYTALAGMFSVAYTDVANGILMVLGIGLALPILWSKAGGFGEALASLPADRRELFGHLGPRELVNVLLPPFLLVLGDANMYQRFFAARDARSARRAAAGMFVGVLLLECAIIALALLGSSLVARGAIEPPRQPAHVVVHLAFLELPPVLGAMLVATVVAVVVSTADSYLLSPATSLVRDVYARFLRTDASERETVLAGRVVVVLLGLIALALAFASDRFFGVALFAYTVYGASVTPALLAAFFWRRATSGAALASMVTGVGATVVWGLWTGGHERLDAAGWHGLAAAGERLAALGVDAVLPAGLASVLVLVVVSLLSSPPDPARAAALAPRPPAR